MELVGLAVGIAGSAGLFTTSLDAIHKYDSWKDSGIESRAFAAQFEAHSLRLERWGEAVGIMNQWLGANPSCNAEWTSQSG